MRKLSKSRAQLSLAELRAEVQAVREEGLKIQSHYKRLEKEYSDWEDRFYALEKAVDEAETITGLNKQDIYEDKGIFNDIGELSEVDDDLVNMVLDDR